MLFPEPFLNGMVGVMAKELSVEVNGVTHQSQVESRLLLVHYLREVLGLTGTHVGCETSMCGACTVIVDGQAVKSCTMFAVQADQSKITTIEGLKINGAYHPADGLARSRRAPGQSVRRAFTFHCRPCRAQNSITIRRLTSPCSMAANG